MRTPVGLALLPEGVDDPMQVSGWYLVKLFLARPEAQQAAGEESLEQMGMRATTDRQTAQQEEQVPDAHLYKYLEPVQVRSTDGVDIGTMFTDLSTRSEYIWEVYFSSQVYIYQVCCTKN